MKLSSLSFTGQKVLSWFNSQESTYYRSAATSFTEKNHGSSTWEDSFIALDILKNSWREAADMEQENSAKLRAKLMGKKQSSDDQQATLKGASVDLYWSIWWW